MRNPLVVLLVPLGLAIATALMAAVPPASDLASAHRASSDVGSKLQTFDALCRALEENYPMLDYVGWQPSWVAEFRTKVAAAPDATIAYELMDELVCRLNDYHTRFSWPGKPALASPAIGVEPALISPAPVESGIWGQWRPSITPPKLDGVIIAVTSAAEGSTARPGDILLAVDDVPVATALARAWPHAVGCSIAGKLRSAAGRMLRGAAGSSIRVDVERADGASRRRLTLDLPRVAAPAEPVISTTEVGDIPVIRISRWRTNQTTDLVAEFDRLLAAYRTRPAIVIDVRDNGGGDDALAEKIIGRFITQPVIASISFRRIVPTMNFERRTLTVEPRGPWRYAGRVAVLTDEGSMSATEHFVSGMAEAGALLCGTPTSGACGLIRPVDLPGGAKINVSRTFPIHTGGAPSPLLGIIPHLWQPPTVSDLRANKDSALGAALRWIEHGGTLPPRLQPAVPFVGRPAESSAAL